MSPTENDHLENSNPSVLGEEPLLGTVRRSLGLPVLRDMVFESHGSVGGSGIADILLGANQSNKAGRQSSDGRNESGTENAGDRIPEIDF